MKPWQEYIFKCFPKNEFVNVPKEIYDRPSLLFKRFGTYEDFEKDVIERNGPIASATLSLLFKPKVVVEIGINVGWTSLLLSKLNPNALVIGVDINAQMPEHPDIPTGYIVTHLHKCKNYVRRIMDSKDLYLPGQVDLCFIDGNHDEEPVWFDSLRAWDNSNYLNNWWCIAWDDYHPNNVGVTKSVDRFIKQAQVNLPLQKAWSWYWIGNKTATEAQLEYISVDGKI